MIDRNPNDGDAMCHRDISPENKGESALATLERHSRRLAWYRNGLAPIPDRGFEYCVKTHQLLGHGQCLDAYPGMSYPRCNRGACVPER